MKVAVQLYTIRDKVSEDYVNALKAVSEIGYRAVEFAGHPFGTVKVEELRQLLERLGLKPVSAHVGFKSLEEEPEKVLGYAARLGLSYIVSEPNVRAMKNVEDCLEAAEKMNRIGERARDADMRFGMHNHASEFEVMFNGKTAYEILVENTDPELVFFQPDVYWVKYAGYDPVEIIRRLKGRCFLVHLKDMRADGGIAELGQGIIDFKAVVEAGEASGVDWYIVENDRPSLDSIESIKLALKYLKNNFEVE